jgi:U3 small nucleolar RNA-associated protein 19
MNKHSATDYPNLAVNLLTILEHLTTFPTEQSELNAWWVSEFGAKPSKPKRGKKDAESSCDEDDLGKGLGVEEDDWRKFFEEEHSVENGPQTKQPGIRLQKMTIHQSLHSLSSHQAVFTRAWLTLLPRLSDGGHVEKTKSNATRVLNIMHRGVMPHLTRPILLMDWITSCVDFGVSFYARRRRMLIFQVDRLAYWL